MQAVTSPPAVHAPVATARIAVVARDDLTARRIAEALDGAGLAVIELAENIGGLSDSATTASSIVLAGTAAANERKALIRDAARRFPDVPVVLIGSGTSNSLHRAIEAGAAGVVYDAQIETALAATVAAVSAGQVVVPRELRRHATRPALSHRERQTLALVVMGLTNRQIAGRLSFAESTVKTHLTSIFGKLGVGSRSEAVALVLDPEQKLGFGILGFSQGAPIGTAARGQGL